MSSRSSSALLQCLNRVWEPILDVITKADYASKAPLTPSNPILLCLLPPKENSESGICDSNVRTAIRDFNHCCAALNSTYDQLSWVSGSLSAAANSAFTKLADAYYDSSHVGEELVKTGETDMDFQFLANDKRLWRAQGFR